jgi:hypothetical protein
MRKIKAVNKDTFQAKRNFLSVSRLNRMLANEGPQERYLNLIKQRPELIEKIPQHYIETTANGVGCTKHLPSAGHLDFPLPHCAGHDLDQI